MPEITTLRPLWMRWRSVPHSNADGSRCPSTFATRLVFDHLRRSTRDRNPRTSNRATASVHSALSTLILVLQLKTGQRCLGSRRGRCRKCRWVHNKKGSGSTIQARFVCAQHGNPSRCCETLPAACHSPCHDVVACREPRPSGADRRHRRSVCRICHNGKRGSPARDEAPGGRLSHVHALEHRGL